MSSSTSNNAAMQESSGQEQQLVVRYTDEQQAAITMRELSVAISAGAGCGKTFVLTERFLAALSHDGPPAGESLEEGLVADEVLGDGPADTTASPLHRVVAITFTERAAREMRDRIREKLYARERAATDQREAALWQRLIRDLDAARISTIHSFCTSLLRGHAVEAKLDPQFSVLDQTEADTLLTETIDDALREMLAIQRPDVLELVYHYQIQGLRERLRGLILSATQTELIAWHEKSVDEVISLWQAFHKQEVLPAALREVAESDNARRVLLLLAEAAEQNEKVLAVRGTLEDLLRNLTTSSNPAGDLEVIHETAKVAKVGSKKAFADPNDYDDYKASCERLRKTITKQATLVDFDVDAARPAAELGKQLLAVTLSVRQEYEERKRSQAQLDFNDLLERTHRLLTGPDSEAICRKIGGQIDLLMVDEFQDTDPVQDELVRRLCGDDLATGKLFFVGDFKQSIYRFRGAQPEVFKKLQEQIPDRGRLPLSRNFRSQPAILEFVNALFHDAFGGDYAYVPLQPSRAQVTPRPAIEFLWTHAERATVKGNTRKARQEEADWIARRIRKLIDEETPLVYVDDDSPPRPVRPGDVALLFRALSDVDIYEQALREHNLDYYLVGGHAFYAQQEIFDLVNLLRAIASTCDTVSLAGVLRSPFFGLTDETLFWLAQHRAGLYGGLFDPQVSEQIRDDQLRQVQFAARTLRYLEEQKDRLPVARLIGEAIARTGYDAVLLTEFLGERKLANLHKLIQLARNFDRIGSFGLPEFITQLTEFVARQPKESPAATQVEDTDVVRLMTIHQAKGLEFPVVVVPDMNRQGAGHGETVAFNQQLGVLVQPAADKSSSAKSTATAITGMDLHRHCDAIAEEAERSRLFYVAATRAADYLMLSSSVEDLASPKSSWLKQLAARFDLETGEMLGELPEGYRTPEVTITTQRPELARRGKSTERRRLKSVLEETHQRLQDDGNRVPGHAAAIAPNSAERREFSFSQLRRQLAQKSKAQKSKTVESITAEAHADFEDDYKDADAEAARSEGALLGTLVHNVLAEDLGKAPPSADVLAAVERHATGLEIPIGPLREEAAELISRFLETGVAAAIANAAEVHREVEFVLRWPPDAEASTLRTQIRGFIDCLYRDAAGDWHVVDYKTNRTTAEGVSEVAARYEMQMLLYALAAEQAIGIAPSSLTLCFLRPGVEQTIPYDEEGRRRLHEFVDEAIATASSPTTQHD